MLIPRLIPSAYILNKVGSPWAVVIMFEIRMHQFLLCLGTYALVAIDVQCVPANPFTSWGGRCIHKPSHPLRLTGSTSSRTLLSQKVPSFFLKQDWSNGGLNTRNESVELTFLLMKCHRWVWHRIVFICLAWQVSDRYLICWIFTISGVLFTFSLLYWTC